MNESNATGHSPYKSDPLDALRWGANVAETLLSIGRAIGFGRAQQILGEQWEADHGCAPRGRMGVTVKDAALSMESLPKDVIRSIFMAHGFTIKDGQDDLKQYVYEAAEALIRASHGQAPK